MREHLFLYLQAFRELGQAAPRLVRFGEGRCSADDAVESDGGDAADQVNENDQHDHSDEGNDGDEGGKGMKANGGDEGVVHSNTEF